MFKNIYKYKHIYLKYNIYSSMQLFVYLNKTV